MLKLGLSMLISKCRRMCDIRVSLQSLPSHSWYSKHTATDSQIQEGSIMDANILEVRDIPLSVASLQARITLKPCEYKCTPTAASVGSTSRSASTRRRSCLRSSSCTCQPPKTRPDFSSGFHRFYAEALNPAMAGIGPKGA